MYTLKKYIVATNKGANSYKLKIGDINNTHFHYLLCHRVQLKSR